MMLTIQPKTSVFITDAHSPSSVAVINSQSNDDIYLAFGAEQGWSNAPLKVSLSLRHAERLLERLLEVMPPESLDKVMVRTLRGVPS